jgi:8-hydroxy-5-deazaflavin:NADPH oxidoreductase
MTDITIIGTGKMARGIAARALAAGKSVQILGKDTGKAAELAKEFDATAGGATEIPAGQIVVLALPFAAAKEVASRYGDVLTGKVVVDISNPADYETLDSLVVAPGSSAAEEIAALTGADVVKAFNTTFSGTLVAGEVSGQPLDVFIAGDSLDATSAVAEFVAAAGMRPIAVGGLKHARELEGFMLLVMGMQANPDLPGFNWNTGLKILG